MREFEASTLWRVSAFERERGGAGEAPFARDGGPSLLSTTLIAELDRLDAEDSAGDVLEVVAACLRHREAALICLECAPWVWPLTIFPAQQLAHSTRDLSELGPVTVLAGLRVISVERPGVRPPGHWMHERVAAAGRYRPLQPLLWRLALEGPRSRPLAEIGGRAAYRLAPGPIDARPAAPGALRPAMLKLKQDAAPLRDIARWPGMSLERASRLLNALYLTGGLMVTRSHPAARDEPQPGRMGAGRPL